MDGSARRASFPAALAAARNQCSAAAPRCRMPKTLELPIAVQSLPASLPVRKKAIRIETDGFFRQGRRTPADAADAEKGFSGAWRKRRGFMQWSLMERTTESRPCRTRPTTPSPKENANPRGWRGMAKRTRLLNDAGRVRSLSCPAKRRKNAPSGAAYYAHRRQHPLRLPLHRRNFSGRSPQPAWPIPWPAALCC